MGLKSALKKLDEAVEDLTSLHVQTFVGTIQSTDENVKFSDIKTLVNNSDTNSDVKLVAETLAQFDGDSYNFVNEDWDQLPKIAIEIHKNAVKSGVETRLGLLDLFKDLID
ncbi:hypothetical protein [Aureivirga marina]|uniref:hypothetical protein n=1 Tax=Aureivirga marina TaxID=1182451 RepID=UPI0018C98055|nr:hypothetical protein [Aureivirga marina]